VWLHLREEKFSGDRSLMVDALLRASGCSADDVQFAYGCRVCGSSEHGKPRVVSPAGWYISVSRAEKMVAVAVTRSADVGVDITSVAAVSRADIGPVARHEADDGETTREIAESWAAKEAVLKATGWGLHLEPSTVGIAEGEVQFWPAELELHDAPSLGIFEVNDLVGAVVVLGQPGTIRLEMLSYGA